MQSYIFFSKITNKYYKIFTLYISIICTLTKSEITITDLVDLSENCSRKGGASDESAKSVNKKNKICVFFSHPKNMSSCLHVKKTCLLVDKTRLPVRYANIVQTVKRCYKIKIDSGDLCYCFCGVLLRYWHLRLSIKPLLHAESSAFIVQERLYCFATVAILECKSGCLAI